MNITIGRNTLYPTTVHLTVVGAVRLILAAPIIVLGIAILAIGYFILPRAFENAFEMHDYKMGRRRWNPTA